ncbi:MAG: hypothetical protein ACSHW0_00445 [Thalassotalea sp.]
MRKKSLTAIILTLAKVFSIAALSSVAAANQTVFTRVDSYSYSEPTPIDSFINKFNGELAKGEEAISLNQLELGVQVGNFSFSLLRRYDYLYKFSDDTARFYYQTENDIEFTEQQRYQLALNAKQFDAKGLKLAYDWQISPSLSVVASASYLQANDFYHVKLSGSAIWQGEDDFSLDAPAQIYSAHNLLLEIPKANATGKGFSSDLAVKWQLAQDWQWNLSVKDLWSKINWQDALYSQVNRWEVHRLTPNGKLDSRPLLEGAILNYQQKLPPKWRSKLAYQAEYGFTWYADVFYSEFFLHKRIGVLTPKFWGNEFALAWHIDTKALELGYAMKYGNIRLMSDSLTREKAKAVAINASLSIPF